MISDVNGFDWTEDSVNRAALTSCQRWQQISDSRDKRCPDKNVLQRFGCLIAQMQKPWLATAARLPVTCKFYSNIYPTATRKFQYQSSWAILWIFWVFLKATERVETSLSNCENPRRSELMKVFGNNLTNLSIILQALLTLNATIIHFFIIICQCDIFKGVSIVLTDSSENYHLNLKVGCMEL